MVMDFADLKAAVRAVLADYDHGHWNDVLDYPSVENICALLHRRLSDALAFPLTLRVYEGHGKFAEM
jgi:6-pyruvoyltetrahydropterin/6-carboxytetrahydropterin synthase